MAEVHLLVSHPPHGEPREPAVAASALKLSPAELRARLAQPAPEIWEAGEDRGALVRRGRTLVGLGLRVFLVAARAAAAVPAARAVAGFRLEEKGATWILGANEELPVTSEAKILAVSAEPKQAPGLPPRSATKAKGFRGYHKEGAIKRLGVLGKVGEAIATDLRAAERRRAAGTLVAGGSDLPTQGHPWLDLYAFRGGKPLRLTVLHGVTRFQGLGGGMAASYRRNLQLLVEALRSRYGRFHEDRRLVGAHLSEPIVSGTAYRTLWGRIDPVLESAERVDLASRLVFLSYVRR